MFPPRKKAKDLGSLVMNYPPWGTEPPSQEPESYDIHYTKGGNCYSISNSREFYSKKAYREVSFWILLVRISPNKSAIEQFEFSGRSKSFFLFWTTWARSTFFLFFAFFLSWTFFKSFDRKWYTFIFAAFTSRTLTVTCPTLRTSFGFSTCLCEICEMCTSPSIA